MPDFRSLSLEDEKVFRKKNHLFWYLFFGNIAAQNLNHLVFVLYIYSQTK